MTRRGGVSGGLSHCQVTRSSSDTLTSCSGPFSLSNMTKSASPFTPPTPVDRGHSEREVANPAEDGEGNRGAPSPI
jgi:hypothetical protein